MQPLRRLLFVFYFFILGPCANTAFTLAGEPESRPVEFIPIPVVFYTPETGGGGGASFVMLYGLPGEPAASRPSQLSSVGFYTQNNQYLVSLAPKFYFRDEEYLLDLGMLYQKFPDEFYGLGNDTRPDDMEGYTRTVTKIEAALSRRWFGSFYLGPMYQLYHYDITDPEDGGLLAGNRAPGATGRTASSLGVIAEWDSRDSTFAARTGGLYRVIALASDPALGGDDFFAHYTVDLRRYFPFFEQHALALQLYSEILTDRPPFPLYAKLGGSLLLRGIYEGRFRDKSSLVTQAEYRFPIYWRFGGAVFAGTGGVAERPNFMYLPAFHYSLGGGLRFRIAKQERINIRLDVGASEDDVGFYFVFGEAF